MAKTIRNLAIFSDKPTKDDLLNFKDYSDLLSNVILHNETPSTIGIFGEWGSGKTSLMLMIEDQLIKKNIKTIWFNAWKYNKEEALWRALILCILNSLNKDQNIDIETKEKLYEAISTEKLGQMQVDWLEIGKALVQGIGSFILIPGIANYLASGNLVDKMSNAFTRRKIQQNQERISSIEEFESLYKNLIKVHIKENERIVILIDDLDRCVPIQSIEVLEALKTFLDAEGCVFVVACDTRLINQGLKSKYPDNSNIDLDDYLGKIVQFAFTIPPIHVEDAERFINNFDLSIGYPELSRLISKTLERNPRKIKRFLSDLKIKNQLVKSRNLLLKPECLVKMSCISYTWREFWLASINDTTVFSRAVQIAISPFDGAEKSPDDIEFSNVFHIDDRLYHILKIEPIITQADLNEFIFLSKTTSLSIFDNQTKEEKNPEYINRFSLIKNYLKEGHIYPYNRENAEMVISSINSGTSLISVSGKPGAGKTTLLYLIEIAEANDYVSVYFDFQQFFQIKENSWTYELSRVIKQTLNEKGYAVQFDPPKNNYTTQDFYNYLSLIIGELKGKRLVLMLDEFTNRIYGLDEKSGTMLFNMISFLLKNNPNLTIILSGQIEVIDLPPQIQEIISKLSVKIISLNRLNEFDLENLYKYVMSIPNEDFNLSDSYNLLFLLENELRLLITLQFDRHDWWQEGLNLKLSTKTYYNSINNQDNGKVKLSSLTLGDLFQIITTQKNWEEIFSDIFESKSIFDDQKSIILRARNSIAHSKELTSQASMLFVISAKDILRSIHPINFTPS